MIVRRRSLCQNVRVGCVPRRDPSRPGGQARGATAGRPRRLLPSWQYRGHGPAPRKAEYDSAPCCPFGSPGDPSPAAAPPWRRRGGVSERVGVRQPAVAARTSRCARHQSPGRPDPNGSGRLDRHAGPERPGVNRGHRGGRFSSPRARWNRCRNALTSVSRPPGCADRRSSRLALLAGSCPIDGRRQRATVCRRAAHNPNAGLRHLRARPPRRCDTRSRAGPRVTSGAPMPPGLIARRTNRDHWRHPHPFGWLKGVDRCRIRRLRFRASASAGSGRTGAPHLDPHPGGRASKVQFFDGPPSVGGARRA